MLLVHGWGMHARAYTDLVDALSRAGVIVHAIDLPGHGCAAQTPFNLVQIRRALVDAASELEHREPDQALVIVADSAGATEVLAFGAELGRFPLALLAPGVAVHPRQLFSRRAIIDNTRLTLRGRLDLPRWRIEEGSSNPAFVERRSNDPRARASVGRGYVWTVARAAAMAIFSGARGVRQPVKLWRAGGDRIVSAFGFWLLARRIPDHLRVVEIVPGADHVLLSDPRHGQDVIASIIEWVKTQSTNGASHG